MILDLSLNEITTDRCLVINEQQTIEVSRSLESSSDLKILENLANLRIKEILSKNKFPINVLPSLKGRVLKLYIIFSNDFMNKEVIKKIRLQSIVKGKTRLVSKNLNIDEAMIQIIKYEL